jgi:predicted RNase H-like nuclease (RuvC/YqgF family)
MAGSQDVGSLDRRISSLEQRLYSIETSINRLEQSAISQRAPVSQPSARDQEINLLRGEIQTLQLRVNEIECGLVKLDERTTVSAVRETRRSDGARTTDPCRLNPATPLRLSTRP